MAQSISDGTSQRWSWSYWSNMSLQPTVTVDFQLHKAVCVLLFELGFSGGSALRIRLPRQETWLPSLGQEDPLQKEMATYSSIFAC